MKISVSVDLEADRDLNTPAMSGKAIAWCNVPLDAAIARNGRLPRDYAPINELRYAIGKAAEQALRSALYAELRVF